MIMSDEKYFKLYGLLEESVYKSGKVDQYILYEICREKLNSIIGKAYGEVAGKLDIIEYEDLCNDIYLILLRSVADKYFKNPSYETGPILFLKWSKVVTKNYILSVLRKGSVKLKKKTEELDPEDKPHSWASADDNVLRDMINKEDIRIVYNTVAALDSKIEMKLVWFGVVTEIYTGNSADRKRATHSFVDNCSNMALDDIFEKQVGIFKESEYECLKVNDRLLEEMRRSLDKTDGDGRRLGAQPMGKYLGDDPLGKVSDWIFKINKKLKQIKEKEGII